MILLSFIFIKCCTLNEYNINWRQSNKCVTNGDIFHFELDLTKRFFFRAVSDIPSLLEIYGVDMFAGTTSSCKQKDDAQNTERSVLHTERLMHWNNKQSLR